VEIEEIDDASVEYAVIYVAQGAGENKTQREGLCLSHRVPDKDVYQGGDDEDGHDREDVPGVLALVENTEDASQVPHVDDGKEGRNLYLTQQGEVPHDERLCEPVQGEDDRY